MSARCRACGAPVAVDAPPEPPVGTWVRDRFGGLHMHHPDAGWGLPGYFPLGRWQAMLEARGPLVECAPWGRDEQA